MDLSLRHSPQFVRRVGMRPVRRAFLLTWKKRNSQTGAGRERLQWLRSQGSAKAMLEVLIVPFFQKADS